MFEYDVTVYDVSVADAYTLEKRGRAGWELCTVVPDGESYVFYWKRRSLSDLVEPKHDPVEPIKPEPHAVPDREKNYQDPWDPWDPARRKFYVGLDPAYS